MAAKWSRRKPLKERPMAKKSGATGFMVKNPDGCLMLSPGVSITRKAARDALLRSDWLWWREAYRKGYRVVLVDIRELAT